MAGPPPEADRAGLVAQYDVPGAVARRDMADIASFAAELCGAPVALVTVMDETYQHFLSAEGTDLPGNRRDLTFCTHVMNEAGVAVVNDATRDARFAGNPLVAGEPGLRFYAGARMVSPEGMTLGSVCVFDLSPRDELSPVQRHGLELLARAAMGRLDDRRVARVRDAEQTQAQQSLADSERRFRTLADTMPQMVWSAGPDGLVDYWNARWYEVTGVPKGSTDGEAWEGVIHPDDIERTWANWRRSLAGGDPYEIEYRIRHRDGGYRWALGRALPIRDADGAITRWFGTCTDIHEQKLAMEEREVVAQELAHRIKNLFAVIAGLVGFSARARPEFAPAAHDLRQRITSLGRAHEFVRPHSKASAASADRGSLRGLLVDLFAPYDGDAGPRVRVTGEDLQVDDRAATPLALLFHELATNAAKYGALSTPDGHVDLSVGADGEDVMMTWRERGGPPVSAPDGKGGFGTQLIELSAVRQLGGAVSRDWSAEGLVVTARTPRRSLSRP